MTKLMNSAFCVMVCVLCGCTQQPDPNMERTISLLGEINGQLEKMHCRTNPFLDAACADETDASYGWGDGIDYLALERIEPLSSAPVGEDVTRYLQSLADAVRNRKPGVSSPRIAEMVAKIGPGHLKELAPFWDRLPEAGAAAGVFRKEDVEEALERLPRYPALYEAIRHYEGEESPRLKAAFFRAFEENQDDLSALSGAMLAYIKTPEDLEFFADCYRKNPAACFVLEKIKYFPAVDENKLAAEAWLVRDRDTLHNRLRLAETQLKLGNPEALALVINRGGESAAQRLKTAECFWEPEAARAASWEAVVEYYRANRELLVFEPQRKMYIIRNGVEQ
jgi:hypothetical protein